MFSSGIRGADVEGVERAFVRVAVGMISSELVLATQHNFRQIRIASLRPLNALARH